jgi:hypothetical protein
VAARELPLTAGEVAINTQVRQGAVVQGFDSVSAVQTPRGIQVFVNEVRNSALLQSPIKFSALGLNRRSTFDLNLARAIDAVQGQVANPGLAATIEDALLNGQFTIRIIGRPGIRITPRTESLIQRATGTNQGVIVLDALAP